MGLHFCYIRAFRNIKNLGINFSAKYVFGYDPDRNELSIGSPSSRLIEGFWGEGITEITAILDKDVSRTEDARKEVFRFWGIPWSPMITLRKFKRDIFQQLGVHVFCQPGIRCT